MYNCHRLGRIATGMTIVSASTRLSDFALELAIMFEEWEIYPLDQKIKTWCKMETATRCTFSNLLKEEINGKVNHRRCPLHTFLTLNYLIHKYEKQ